MHELGLSLGFHEVVLHSVMPDFAHFVYQGPSGGASRSCPWSLRDAGNLWRPLQLMLPRAVSVEQMKRHKIRVHTSLLPCIGANECCVEERVAHRKT